VNKWAVNSDTITEQNVRQIMAQRETERASQAHLDSQQRNADELAAITARELQKSETQRQAAERRTAIRRKASGSINPKCFDLFKNLHDLFDSHDNHTIAYFNTLSTLVKNVKQELSGTELEPLIEDINEKSKIIFQCLAKQIDQNMTDVITPLRGGKSRRQGGRKNKRTKRNK
jgi:superoxide dismutase